MSIIMRDEKNINTNTPEENKKQKLREIGPRITARRQEAEKVVEEIKQERKKEKGDPKRKKKSTQILLRTQTVLKKAIAAWPSRDDLRELSQDVDKVVIADNFNNHTKTFIKVLSVLDTVIPLWGGDFSLKLMKLQKLIRLLNKKERNYNFTKVNSAVTTVKAHLTKGDIDRWIDTAKKGARLVYYTGHTFDQKEYQQQKVFAHVRDLCFDFAPVASTKKFYTTTGGSEWGIKYHNVITLMQQKVVPQQKDHEKNIISHAIYNYIMEKL